MSSESWWTRDFYAATGQLSDYSMIPAAFTREYHVLAEVCSSMTSGFMLLNQQRVIYSNPSALRLLQISKRDLVTPQDFSVRDHLLALAADPRQAHSELENLWQHPEQEYSTDLALADAAARWLRIRSFPVHDNRGMLLGRGLLFDDITLERSAAEAQGETLARAAHELKTPLAIIKGCATTLLGSSARWDPAMQREMLQMIDTQSDRLYEVLNTLLDVWRLDSGAQPLRLTQVNLAELLDQFIRRWQKHSPNHRFVLSIMPDVPMLMCDPLRVEQILTHLLNNAVAYSPAGSVISVRLEINEVEARIGILDEGIGIAQEHLDRIFDRFYHVPHGDEQSSGSGLGLAAARAAVQAHGGRIWAESPGPGEGASFYFTLPFAPKITVSAQQTAPLPALQDTAPLTLGTSRTAPLRQDRRVHVLLAESDQRLTRYLRANLEEQQYRVHTVNHGIQFLRHLDLDEPDIILLSSRLADMSGVELLQRLREFSQIPIIMLCDDDSDEDERVYLFDLGCDDVVMKPFGMKELLARVRAILRRRAAGEEKPARSPIFRTGELEIDHAQHQVTVGGKPVQLSRTEYNLLNVLAQNAGRVVTHELLLEKVWGPEYNRDVDFIWVYISRLRRKIEADSRRPRYIVTVPDVGYKLMKL